MGGTKRRPFVYLRRPRRAIQQEIDEEIRDHIERRSAALRAQGYSENEARAEAERQFGDIDATRRYCREQDERKDAVMIRRLVVQDLTQDIRTSIRSLLRVPALTLTVIFSVGFGIGGTTAMLAAVNATMLRPLPYQDPDRLFWIYTDSPPFEFRLSLVDYQALESQQTAFERVAVFTNRSSTFSSAAGADLVRGRQVSWGYFGLLGIRPALGRDFVEADGRTGGAPAVIVSHEFWQNRLGGSVSVVGTTIRLDGVDHVLAGVLPPLVSPLERNQEFFSVAPFTQPRRRGPFPYWTLGRLKAGVDASAASTELHTINRRVFPAWRSSYQDERATWRMKPLRERLVGNVGPTAALALTAVALVWLIACTNASNLIVARVLGRRREMAVRTALGASRARLVRHLLVESGVLAVISAVVGLGLAWGAVELLRTAGAAYFPRTAEIHLDGQALTVLALITGVTALAIGLLPAMIGARGEAGALGSGTRTAGSVGARRVRQALVGTQFAIATPLLVMAALMLVSLQSLRSVDIGLDGTNILTGSIRLPSALYPSPARVRTYWTELDGRLRALPEIADVAFSDSLPPATTSNINNFDLEESPTPAGQSQPATTFVAVTPDFFRLAGLQAAEGRLLMPGEEARETLESVVVDRAWANRFFPGRSAVGRRFKEGGCTECPWTTVVGVVENITFAGLDQPAQGTVYTPLQPSLTGFLLVRTRTAPSAALPGMQRAVRELDPEAPLTSLATIDALVEQSLVQPRATSLLLAGFATLALLLSLVGIYGVLAYYVQQQSKEISIRLALGGTIGNIRRLIVGQGMVVAAAGVVVGLALAAASTRFMTTLLFGVGALDPYVFTSVGVLLLVAAAAACYFPALRASRLPPAAALRAD
jgi:putative ABC transport system permease protein